MTGISKIISINKLENTYSYYSIYSTYIIHIIVQSKQGKPDEVKSYIVILIKKTRKIHNWKLLNK